MTRARIDRVASAVLLAGVASLIVDMFLGWVRVAVYSPGVFGTSLTLDMEVTGWGWAGWGIAGGVCAVLLALRCARSLRRGRRSVGGATVTAALAAATAAFTIWQALTGEADVVAAEGTLSVTVTRLWPAAAAVGLAVAVAAAAATLLVTAAASVARSGGGRIRTSVG